ncbi:hypothetical protein BASA61_003727 [Batrachochytrium salamandrivorans]|nr:hypothetical protein BASA61_003727 [Batrachochytrium salamandrivorans]
MIIALLSKPYRDVVLSSPYNRRNRTVTTVHTRAVQTPSGPNSASGMSPSYDGPLAFWATRAYQQYYQVKSLLSTPLVNTIQISPSPSGLGPPPPGVGPSPPGPSLPGLIPPPPGLGHLNLDLSRTPAIGSPPPYGTPPPCSTPHPYGTPAPPAGMNNAGGPMGTSHCNLV